MADELQSENIKEAPVLQILKQIKEGTLKAETLPKDIRQDCVEHLWFVEAQPVAVIAHLLKVSDKTIRRDEDVIRARRAQQPSTDYMVTVFGELLQKATSAHENMMRLSRSHEGSIQEKAQAGYYSWKMIQEQIKIAQSLGVAPSEAMKIDATVRHENEINPAQLKAELARLEKIATEGGSINDPEVVQLREEVNRNIALAEAKQGLSRLEEKINDLNKAKELPDGQ